MEEENVIASYDGIADEGGSEALVERMNGGACWIGHGGTVKSAKWSEV
jgi:hypothetical protein